MFRPMQRGLALALMTGGLLAPTIARSDGDVSVALIAQRVTMNQGRESFAPADHAKPGEIVEYRATYSNRGTTAARSLTATLPIPRGTEFVPGTVRPTRVEASLDGKRFAAAPLMRRVRHADGRETLEPVPPSEYRALRWPLGTLDANSSRTVVARVRVAPLQLAAATR